MHGAEYTQAGCYMWQRPDLIDNFVVVELESLIKELFEETQRFLVGESVEIPFHLDVCCLVQEGACWSFVVVDNCHLIKVIAS